jgi:hypothetical protein
MRRIFGGKLLVGVLVAAVLIACGPVCQASGKTKAEKHALKIEKELSKFKAGAYLHLTFNDNTESSGHLGTLGDASFEFNNSENNAKETHQYGDVSKVERAKEYIGEGSVKHHHRGIL